MEAKKSFIDCGASTSSTQPNQKCNCDITLGSTQERAGTQDRALTQSQDSTNQVGILKSFSANLYEIFRRSKGCRRTSGVHRFVCIQRNTMK